MNSVRQSGEATLGQPLNERVHQWCMDRTRGRVTDRAGQAQD